MRFNATWIRQPTTMLGLAIIVATILLALLGLIPVGVLAALLPPAAGLVIVDDNTEFSQDAQALAIDAVTSVTTNHLQANLPRLVQEGIKAAGDLAPKVAAVVLLLLLSGGLAACGTNAAKDSAIACQIDGVASPIASATLAALVPEAAAGLSVNALIVHPAIVKYCASSNATPVPNPAVPPVTPAPAPVTTPAVTPAPVSAVTPRASVWLAVLRQPLFTPWAPVLSAR